MTSEYFDKSAGCHLYFQEQVTGLCLADGTQQAVCVRRPPCYRDSLSLFAVRLSQTESNTACKMGSLRTSQNLKIHGLTQYGPPQSRTQHCPFHRPITLQHGIITSQSSLSLLQYFHFFPWVVKPRSDPNCSFSFTVKPQLIKPIDSYLPHHVIQGRGLNRHKESHSFYFQALISTK